MAHSYELVQQNLPMQLQPKWLEPKRLPQPPLVFTTSGMNWMLWALHCSCVCK